MNGLVKNGNVEKPNKYFDIKDKRDFLYHFGFGVDTLDIPAVFGDTKVGSTKSRKNWISEKVPSLVLILVHS